MMKSVNKIMLHEIGTEDTNIYFEYMCPKAAFYSMKTFVQCLNSAVHE